MMVMTSKTDEKGVGVYVHFPLPEERLFRNQATEDILRLFTRNPHQEFTVTELRETTGHGGDTIQTAIEVLEAAELIHARKEGRAKLISANRDRIHVPEDPLLSVPQEEFRAPIKAFLDGVQKLEIELVGIILFGSVARGEADRASDIDIQVIVDHKLTEARRSVHGVRQKVEEQRFDGERYEFQILVESVDSAENYGEKLQEIFSEGIKLQESAKLEEVEGVVFHG